MQRKVPSSTLQIKEDWGLEDPSEKNDEEFFKIINQIEHNILELKERLSNGL